MDCSDLRGGESANPVDRRSDVLATSTDDLKGLLHAQIRDELPVVEANHEGNRVTMNGAMHSSSKF